MMLIEVNIIGKRQISRLRSYFNHVEIFLKNIKFQRSIKYFSR